MRQYFYRLVLLISLCTGLNVYANDSFDCHKLSATGWLLGDWQAKTAKSVTTEQWQSVGDKGMVGVGITASLNNKKPPFIESLRLVEMGGAVFYLAKPPQNELPVAFKLVACSANYLKFVNDKHDFPQTIEYTKHSAKRMVALVSGSGKNFSIDFKRQSAAKSDNITTVKAYVAAYNQRNLADMLKWTSDGIVWMSVYDDKVAVETKNRQALQTALKQHFARARKSHSQLSGVVAYGDFVSAIEQVSSTKDGKARSACSLSVYQFAGSLIKAVWYYPAQSCAF